MKNNPVEDSGCGAYDKGRASDSSEFFFDDQLLWAMLNSSRDGIGIIDEDYRLVECNCSFAKMLGYEKDELIGWHIWDWDADLSEVAIRENYPDISLLNKVIEVRHVRKDGSIINVEVAATGTNFKNQKLGIVACRDITERKREHESLLKTQFAMDRARDNCTWIDGEGRIVYANQAACTTLGYTLDEMLELTLFDIDPEFTPEILVAHQKEVKSIGTRLFESKHITKDGRIFPVEISTNFFGSEGGYLTCSFDRDISERKAIDKALQESNEQLEKRVEKRTEQLQQEIVRRSQSERALRESEAIFKALVEFSHDVVQRFDRQYRHLYVNPAVYDFTGITAADLIGKTIFDFEVLMPLAPLMTRSIDYVFQTAEPYRVEFQMPNGIWVESVLSPELTDDNEVSAVITISRNISARKRVERELEEYSQMQELLMLLASSFINLPIEMVDAAINTALFKVAEFLGADRAYIFHYNFVEQQGTVCHEWCGENIPLRFVGDEKTVSLHTFKPWTVPHRKGRPLHVPDVRVLADSSQLRSNLEQTGVRSLIAVPMMDGRECLGFVGFETIMEPHFFSEKEQQLLIILAQLMISVNLRRQTEQRLVAQSSLQELIAHIASSFVGVKITNYEQKFLETLQVTGEHLGVDRVVLFLFTPDTVLGQNILEWCATGFASRKNVLNPHPFYHASAERRREFLAKQPILHFSDVNDMPKDFAVWQSGLRTLGVKSALFLSIHTDQHIYGVLGFETLGKKTEWSKNQINGLSVLAQILGSTLENISSSQALIEAKRSLEQRVAERTKELEVLVAEKDRTLQELSVAQSSLLEASRQAGMAEVATNVLHNVGNVLNSVNVSGTLLVEQLKHSRVANVAKIAELLANAPQEPARFLLEDPRGRQVPEYLGSLAIALQKERHTMLHEVELLNSRINHIKEIVAMQQDYGQVYGVLETIRPDQLMEDALKLNSGALQRHGVRVRRDYDPVPSITIDKHKVLQILINLINNAKYACDEGGEEEKIITLQLHMHGKDRLRMQVSDSGVGITPENIGKIFQHGFTTRKSGHGFGLHSGALAAKSLGGRLSVASDGPGKGATFSLELPIVRGEDNAT